ncbi:cortex morphogenetic protein CmpA [Gracilibacillus marinus]|uniref:Cortex morphogenetic protein CmpA n=1 Tax=Gracilibacillus marinus TaxID=630535 RepID=A0ABV8VW13_9BACI
MPTWLRNQLTGAFLERNKKRILILNQCWFFYCNKMDD